MTQKGTIIESFESKYLGLGQSEEEYILELLFQLTISYRALFEGEQCKDIAYGLKQINELNHRLLNRVRDLRNGEQWSTKEDTIEMIKHHVMLAPIIKTWVAYAASKAFEKVSA